MEKQIDNEVKALDKRFKNRSVGYKIYFQEYRILSSIMYVSHWMK